VSGDAPLRGLQSPFHCGTLKLANRFVMAPMTRGMSPGNLLGDQAAPYYARRAAGGCGLIVTEGAAIDHPVAQPNGVIPNFSGPSLPVWKKVADSVHREGSAIIAQLWHAGLYRSQADSLNPEQDSIAPSVVGRTPVQAMTDSMIADVIDAYARSAEDAKRVGFDGVEIHGAHGYLPDQFFWPRTNRRTDRYGGPIENRVRFSTEMLSAIRRRVGSDFPIVFRFSQWKAIQYEARIAETPVELEAWLKPLADAGVDIFHASTRRFWVAEFEGSDMNLAGWAKRVTGKPSITVGSVGLDAPLEVGAIGDMPAAALSEERLRLLGTMFDRGDFDLVALGRIVLANPAWPHLVLDGRLDALRPYDSAAVTQRLECAAADAFLPSLRN
jgi:2,4-dienoyl-CoA reductase-like NADH-dependent reductase (Old Yellow Enzyme family)